MEKWKMTKTRIRTNRNDRIFEMINMTLIAMIIVICVYPIYFTLMASISEPNEVISGHVYLWPIKLTLDSYRNILNYSQVWTGYLNTIFYSVFGTAYNLLLLIPASYAMAKKTLKGKNIFMVYFVFTMYFSGGLVPYYLLLKSLGFIDNPFVMIIPGAFSVFNMIIARTFFQTNIPESLTEAAKIDGASEARIFVQIVLPLSGSIIAVFTLFNAVGQWNSYFNAMLFLNNSKFYPLQLVLRKILVLNENINTSSYVMSDDMMDDLIRRQKLAQTMKYALIIISNLPVLIAYPFVQKYFVKGVLIGSIKG